MSAERSETAAGCLPIGGAPEGSVHWLSCEVGDGTNREKFTAIWERGMWKADGMNALSPRKAAWATWEYVGVANAG